MLLNACVIETGNSSTATPSTQFNWTRFGAFSNTPIINNTSNLIFDNSTKSLYNYSFGGSRICQLDVNADNNTGWNCKIQIPTIDTISRNLLGDNNGHLYIQVTKFIGNIVDSYYILTYNTINNTWNPAPIKIDSQEFGATAIFNGLLYMAESTELYSFDLNTGNQKETFFNFFTPAISQEHASGDLSIDNQGDVFYYSGTYNQLFAKNIAESGDARQIGVGNTHFMGHIAVYDNHIYTCGSDSEYSIATNANSSTQWDTIIPIADTTISGQVFPIGCLNLTAGGGYLYAYGQYLSSPSDFSNDSTEYTMTKQSIH